MVLPVSSQQASRRCSGSSGWRFIRLPGRGRGERSRAGGSGEGVEWVSSRGRSVAGVMGYSMIINGSCGVIQDVRSNRPMAPLGKGRLRIARTGSAAAGDASSKSAPRGLIGCCFRERAPRHRTAEGPTLWKPGSRQCDGRHTPTQHATHATQVHGCNNTRAATCVRQHVCADRNKTLGCVRAGPLGSASQGSVFSTA